MEFSRHRQEKQAEAVGRTDKLEQHTTTLPLTTVPTTTCSLTLSVNCSGLGDPFFILKHPFFCLY